MKRGAAGWGGGDFFFFYGRERNCMYACAVGLSDVHKVKNALVKSVYCLRETHQYQS
jgi:hypothetical protein